MFLEFPVQQTHLQHVADARLDLDPEHAAHPHRAFDADRAAHQLDQAFAHHQTDAGALLGPRLLPEAIERLEQLCELVAGQTPAGVAETDAYPLRGEGAQTHVDPAVAANTRQKATAKPAVFQAARSLQYIVDEDAAVAGYDNPAMAAIQRDLLIEGIAAELAFLMSVTEVAP